MQRRKYALLKQPFEMDALGDVSLTNPVLGDVMYYDGSFWINTPYAELVDDRVASLLVAGNNIDLTYNDGAGTITIDVEALTSADISDFNEAVDDRVGSLLTAGSNITLTYNDAGNSLSVAVSGLTSASLSDFAEAVDDRVNALLVAGSNITLTYNDGSNTLTIASAGGSIRTTVGATWVNGTSAVVAADAPLVAAVIPRACTIVGVRVYTQGGTGSCVVDIWKDTHANYPPTVTNTITASAKPTISSGTKYSDDTLTGWTTSCAAGDVVLFKLDSTSTFTAISVFLILE